MAIMHLHRIIILIRNAASIFHKRLSAFRLNGSTFMTVKLFFDIANQFARDSINHPLSDYYKNKNTFWCFAKDEQEEVELNLLGGKRNRFAAFFNVSKLSRNTLIKFFLKLLLGLVFIEIEFCSREHTKRNFSLSLSRSKQNQIKK